VSAPSKTAGRAADFPSAIRWRHDLKNQLGIVVGYSELLLQELDAAHPMRRDLEEIWNAAERAMTILAELEPGAPAQPVSLPAKPRRATAGD
jgi:hypothetical protein